MQRYNSLQNMWFTHLHGRPIRVEEHWSNLSYIVEFYDVSENESGQCLTLDPVTGEELTLEVIKRNGTTQTA